ncbi:MAG: response regulator transcription factor [Clostridiales bacterium]|nr:response regulator transcription factor [Clostridiales bacterium]
MQTILVVEDDISTNRVICEVMKDQGYHVLSAQDGQEAIEHFEKEQVSLVILDIMLPKKSGLEVLSEIRSIKDTPVIMLTAMDDEYTQIKSFEKEADEYVTKPFSPIVLGKRAAALLKRTEPLEKSVLAVGDVVVDFGSYTVTRNGETIPFTTRELQILKYLAEHAGMVLTRDQIIDAVWGLDFDHTDRTVDTHIKNIRRKLDCECIVTVKGVGYRFEKE